MSSSHAQFEQRCEGLVRKHRALARGFTVNVGNDGLIKIAPNRDSVRPQLRIVCATVLGFFLFKASTMVMISPQTYLERIDSLQAGTFFERAAGWLMQPEPVTNSLIALIRWVGAF